MAHHLDVRGGAGHREHDITICRRYVAGAAGSVMPAHGDHTSTLVVVASRKVAISHRGDRARPPRRPGTRRLRYTQPSRCWWSQFRTSCHQDR